MFTLLFHLCLSERISSIPLSTCKLGRITYYTYPDNGACGFGARTGALGPGYLYVAALSPNFYSSGSSCGECYEIAGPHSAVRVMVTDLCPDNGENGVCDNSMDHFDLSEEAFAKLFDTKVGCANITYRRISCDVDGPVKVYVHKESTQYWLSVLVFNHAVGVKSVAIRSYGAADWVQLQRESYNYWTGSGKVTFPVSARITSIYGSVVTAEITAADKGKSVSADAQFPTEELPPVGPTCCGSQNSHGTVYENGGFGGVWSDTSWNAVLNLKSTNSPMSGEYCMEVSLEQYGGFQAYARYPKSSEYFVGVQFYIRAESACDNCLTVFGPGGSAKGTKFGIAESEVGTWKKIRIEGMKDKLGFGSEVQNIAIQSNKQYKFYIDDFHFIMDSSVSDAKCYFDANGKAPSGDFGNDSSGKGLSTGALAGIIVVVVLVIIVGVVAFYIYSRNRTGEKPSA